MIHPRAELGRDRGENEKFRDEFATFWCPGLLDLIQL